MAKNKTGIRRIALITSGGSAPGMNSFIYAAVRQAENYGVECLGVRDGTKGLTSKKADVVTLTSAALRSYFKKTNFPSGTILGSASDGHTPTAREYRNLKNRIEYYGIDALAIIGGDGSMEYVPDLLEQAHVSLPIYAGLKTVDDDARGKRGVRGSVGHDSAAAYNAHRISRLPGGHADAHKRAIFFEVMGRLCGSLPLHSVLQAGSGADILLVPEIQCKPETIEAALQVRAENNQRQIGIIVSEGFPGIDGGNAIKSVKSDGTANVKDGAKRAKTFTKRVFGKLLRGWEMRTDNLGHAQRDAPISTHDKRVAGQVGTRTVDLALTTQENRVVLNNGYSYVGDRIALEDIPLEDFIIELRDKKQQRKSLDYDRGSELLVYNGHDFRQDLYQNGVILGDETPEFAIAVYNESVRNGRRIPDPFQSFKQATPTLTRQ